MLFHSLTKRMHYIFSKKCFYSSRLGFLTFPLLFFIYFILFRMLLSDVLEDLFVLVVVVSVFSCARTLASSTDTVHARSFLLRFALVAKYFYSPLLSDSVSTVP